MDSKSRAILTAAIKEKLELVQMLYSKGQPNEGMAEYAELRRLGHQLREITDGNSRPNSTGTDPDTPTE
jgi:hypothetical protein